MFKTILFLSMHKMNFIPLDVKLKMPRVTWRKCECNVFLPRSFRISIAEATRCHLTFRRCSIVTSSRRAGYIKLEHSLVNRENIPITVASSWCAPTASLIRSSRILLGGEKKKLDTQPGIHWNIGLRFRICATRNEGAFVITSRTHPRLHRHPSLPADQRKKRAPSSERFMLLI